MTAKQIQTAIQNKFSAKAFIPNVYFNDVWETDLLVIGNDDSFSDFEIKRSVFDFAAEFKNKKEKHNNLNLQYDLTLLPNYFWFVVPYRLIPEEDIPHYAGLIYIHQNNLRRYPTIQKPAPLLHNEKPSLETWKKLTIKLANR